MEAGVTSNVNCIPLVVQGWAEAKRRCKVRALLEITVVLLVVDALPAASKA